MSNQIITTCLRTMGSDIDVVNSARVSFDKRSQLNADGSMKAKDARLIRYLANHNHLSPFGHCYASFHVQAPVFVARQLVKHKFLRWNEVSRRYVDYEPDIYSPEHWRSRPDNKKQGSGPAFGDTGQQVLQRDYADMMSMVIKMYERFLELNVAPEQARMVLPQSLMTEWWWSGSLDAFADMCRLRLASDTQAETRLVAEGIDKSMSVLYTYSWSALMDREVGYVYR